MTKQTNYIRLALFEIDEIIPYIFTKKVRYRLHMEGYGHDSKTWKTWTKRAFVVGNTEVKVHMESHRYQSFVENGTSCKICGLKGKYFALERNRDGNSDKFIFNLYGIDSNGNEIMLTKDHIIPRAKHGRNNLSNYQTLCLRCNQRKGCKW